MENSLSVEKSVTRDLAERIIEFTVREAITRRPDPLHPLPGRESSRGEHSLHTPTEGD
jgi:hypothetical protein